MVEAAFDGSHRSRDHAAALRPENGNHAGQYPDERGMPLASVFNMLVRESAS